MHSLTSAPRGVEWLSSRPCRFTLSERTAGTHWIGSWVGPSTDLDMVSNRKIPSPRRESKPDHPIFHPVASRYTILYFL